MDELFDILTVRYLMPEEQIQDLLSCGRNIVVEREECFIGTGQIPGKFGLVISGLFRYVYSGNKGEEFTKAILPEHSFISSYSAMISKSPSLFFIQALEDAAVFEISYEKWLGLRVNDAYWDSFLLGLLEKGFMAKEKRERELLLLDAESRYRNFQKDFPGMENRVKQHIIASFLGIQPETLSRIRKKSIS